MSLIQLVIVSVLVAGAVADTPANCSYEDIQGYWRFQETEPVETRREDCNKTVDDYTREFYVRLDYPNIAVDKQGNKGTWTIIYNQGFEVIINYRKYFAFSAYEKHGNRVVSHCDRTSPGWSHNVLGRNWACIIGQKVSHWDKKQAELIGAIQPAIKEHEMRPLYLENIDMATVADEAKVKEINSVQKLWTAEVYPEFQNMDRKHLINMAGGQRSRIVSRPKPNRTISEELRKAVAELPESFDWRNVNHINYLSPVRNQLQCGSCYAFASMAAMESRIRIQTNNTQQPVLSPQYIVDCSQYAQGCEGGFPYLVAGKHAQDYGIISEECYPYKGYDEKCQLKRNASIKCQQRTYTVDYHYIGGYYGGCNEESMLLELVRFGPIVVAFEVYPDFASYRKGIYTHSYRTNGLQAQFNPFELTNHAVLVVGYGKDNASGEKYWIVKNSWGNHWGMDGYFLIRRGTDECGIESLALAVTPIPN